MKFSHTPTDPVFSIQSYSDDHLIINGEPLRNSLVITPNHLIRNWAPQHFAELTLKHLTALALLQPKPQVVLLGTGPKAKRLELRWLAEMNATGIGMEVMSTDAACRTYNLLLAEGRAVVAALFLN